ncbi:hypothetical protein [Flavobacterium hungaricum]|uniref:Transposase zinc-binding domain-containing protein n=1 Tax=Flavobacterium hungaricum TaxID=2082725 RepID=A0ABR9TSF2_9FLAO|nr:hypothetical protein [Flavobacterium hungaricum]MBE8727962.1 hypothetical protein [Flavobacterium hungaricum]
MEAAKQILIKHCPGLDDLFVDHSSVFFRDRVLKAMEEYAEQFKYDFSQKCKCESSIGQTWCCNQCGLPYTSKPINV